MNKSPVEKAQAAGASLKTLREPYEALLSEVGRNFRPTRTRYYKGKDHKADRGHNASILNSRPVLALRTAKSGMHTGMTSPARPWFRLITTDPAMRENQTVKAHLHAAQRAMRQMMQASGLYNALHTSYGDLLWQGTDAMLVEPDAIKGVKATVLVPGEYWLGANSEGRIDTLYREMRLTTQYIVGKFVYRGLRNGPADWNAVSTQIKRAWEKGDHAQLFEVCHLITPRHERDPRGWLPSDKPIASLYWEKRAGPRRLLGDLGYDRNPIVASRWDVEGTNVWGSAPAWDVLSDARSLQVQERDKREAIRRMNRPPMNAPNEMRNSGFSLMPEAVNFMTDTSKGMVPAMQVNPPYQHLLQDIDTTEYRIDEGMYANLFLMISRLDRRQITAREIDERHEEKLLGLGPVLERQHEEKLGPIVKLVYEAVIRSGKVDPLPEEFDNMPVDIDYISMLAQAQKAVATGGMERLYGFVGNLVAVDETVIDNLDNDRAVQEYGEMLGVPGEVMRPAEERTRIREQRSAAAAEDRQMMQASEAAPALQQTAQAAKVLSEADKTGKPVDILRNLGLR